MIKANKFISLLLLFYLNFY